MCHCTNTNVASQIAALAPKLKARGIRVVTNAGGVNPQACKAAIDEKLKALGIELKVSIVTGDDLLPRLRRLGTLDRQRRSTLQQRQRQGGECGQHDECGQQGEIAAARIQHPGTEHEIAR